MPPTPNFATYTHVHLVTLNSATGAFTILQTYAPTGGATIGDDGNNNNPTTSLGNGTENIGEQMYLSIGANTLTLPDTDGTPGNENEFLSSPVVFSGYSASGEPIVAFNDYDLETDPSGFTEATFYFLISNNPSPSPGTATIGTYTYCFAKGTHVQTSTGEVRVEELRRGDFVRTSDGRDVAVKWVGRQTFSALMARLNRELPVHISAGALGAGLPVRDLLVSPGHAILVDGVLVNASALVNGSSITQARSWSGDVEYFHIETENHELVLAEGVAAETFIDAVDRARFDNYAEFAALYPEASPMVEMDLPRVTHARQLAAQTRSRLDAVAEALALEAHRQSMRAA